VNTPVFVLLTLTRDKLTILMMTAAICYCVFNFLGLSGICIQQHAVGNVFYSTFTNVLVNVTLFTFS